MYAATFEIQEAQGLDLVVMLRAVKGDALILPVKLRHGIVVPLGVRAVVDGQVHPRKAPLVQPFYRIKEFPRVPRQKGHHGQRVGLMLQKKVDLGLKQLRRARAASGEPLLILQKPVVRKRDLAVVFVCELYKILVEQRAVGRKLVGKLALTLRVELRTAAEYLFDQIAA